MKLCPACGTVCPDSEMVCGACGTNVSDVPIESMERIELELRDETRRERIVEQKELKKANVRLLEKDVVLTSVIMIIAIGLLLAGIYLSSRGNPYGIAFILTGVMMFLTMLRSILR